MRISLLVATAMLLTLPLVASLLVYGVDATVVVGGIGLLLVVSLAVLQYLSLNWGTNGTWRRLARRLPRPPATIAYTLVGRAYLNRPFSDMVPRTNFSFFSVKLAFSPEGIAVRLRRPFNLLSQALFIQWIELDDGLEPWPEMPGRQTLCFYVRGEKGIQFRFDAVAASPLLTAADYKPA